MRFWDVQWIFWAVGRAFWCSAVWCIAGTGCVQKELYPIGPLSTDSSTDFAPDTESQPLDTGTGSSEDSDTGFADDTDSGPYGKIVRIPLVVPDNASPDFLFMHQDSNSVGFQGSWYSYADATSQITFTNAGGGKVCTQGMVGQQTDVWTWAGIGLSLCFSDASASPAFEWYTFENCPFAEDLANRVVGASFSITGTFESPLTQFYPKEEDRVEPVYFTLTEAGEADYYFADVIVNVGWPQLNPNDIRALQFQVSNYEDNSFTFDFCIGDLEMLVRPE